LAIFLSREDLALFDRLLRIPKTSEPEILEELLLRSRRYRRVMVFARVASARGRGRIPNALRTEAEALNRAERLDARLRRGPRDPRQADLAFMGGLPEHLRFDFKRLLAPRAKKKKWSYFDFP
jgi:hypothetical protein